MYEKITIERLQRTTIRKLRRITTENYYKELQRTTIERLPYKKDYYRELQRTTIGKLRRVTMEKLQRITIGNY